jgi:hypothetical protein
MKICSHCATHLPPAALTCPECGGQGPDSIREGTGADDPNPAGATPSLFAPTRILDVENPQIRRSVEWGFVLGLLGFILISIRWLSCWWGSGDDGELLGAIILLICSPLGGLFGAVLGGVFGHALAESTSPRKDAHKVPPPTVLAKTDSLDPLTGRLYRDSTDTFGPDSLPGAKGDTREDIQDRSSLERREA